MPKDSTKIKKLYYSIGEVSKATELKQYVLRYWEREFKQIKPKIINKRRYYSNDQISTIKFIKTLIKDNGMTIKGVKKILSSNKKLDYSGLHDLSAGYYMSAL